MRNFTRHHHSVLCRPLVFTLETTCLDLLLTDVLAQPTPSPSPPSSSIGIIVASTLNMHVSTTSGTSMDGGNTRTHNSA